MTFRHVPGSLLNPLFPVVEIPHISFPIHGFKEFKKPSGGGKIDFPGRTGSHIIFDRKVIITGLIEKSVNENTRLFQLRIETGKRIFIFQFSEKTKPSRKILHFGKNLLANALMSFLSENMRTASVQNYPAITSLGYAVSYLDIYDPSRYGNNEVAREKYIT